MLLLLLLGCSALNYSNAFRHLFNERYNYIEPTKCFYKFHNHGLSWFDAKKKCEAEGGSLYYPTNKAEVNAVTSFWREIHDSIESIYVGITNFHVRGHFRAIRGISAFFHWHSGHPKNPTGNEHCVVSYKNGTILDDKCSPHRAFICKKNSSETESEPESEPESKTESEPENVTESEPENVTESEPENVTESEPENVTESEPENVTESKPESEPESKTESEPESVTESEPESNTEKEECQSHYQYLEKANAYYKIHTKGKTWYDAKSACESENATLFYPKSKAELQTVLDFLKETTAKVNSRFTIQIGISDLAKKGNYVAVDGGVPYIKWHSGEPNNGDGYERCLESYDDGTFLDQYCSTNRQFICKKVTDGCAQSTK